MKDGEAVPYLSSTLEEASTLSLVIDLLRRIDEN